MSGSHGWSAPRVVDWSRPQEATTVTEVRLLLTQKSATLVLTIGSNVVEQETWKFDTPAPRRELRDIGECVFNDCYDLMNYATHGAAG